MPLTNSIFDASIPFQKRFEQVFSYQLEEVEIYRKFLNELGFSVENKIAQTPDTVPLLPVEAFRDAFVGVRGAEKPELEFRSSGTTSTGKNQRSVHRVLSSAVYRESIFRGINTFYKLDDFVILGYTPGYSENPNSSLIWMIRELINSDKTGISRFLELEKPIPQDLIKAAEKSGRKILLFGAAFGLIDMAEQFPVSLPSGSVIMETGGMKTHRREMTRSDLHKSLAAAFGLPESQVHSEYGMTELLSQAYSTGDEWFKCPHWMRVSIRNPENPLEAMADGEEGLIGITDLANLYSCSFLLTGDKGIKNGERFKVLGRYYPENLRGCNFLIDDE